MSIEQKSHSPHLRLIKFFSFEIASFQESFTLNDGLYAIRLNYSQDGSTNSGNKLVRLFPSEKGGPPVKLVEGLKINSVLFLKNDKVVTNFVNAISDVS